MPFLNLVLQEPPPGPGGKFQVEHEGRVRAIKPGLRVGGKACDACRTAQRSKSGVLIPHHSGC